MSESNYSSEWRMTISGLGAYHWLPSLWVAGGEGGAVTDVDSKTLEHNQQDASCSTAGLSYRAAQAFILRNPAVLQSRAKELHWSYLNHSRNLCIRRYHCVFPPCELRASLPVGALGHEKWVLFFFFPPLPVKNLQTRCKNCSGITSYSPAGTPISWVP